MEYIDKLINEEEQTQENVHRVVTGEMDGEEITRDETVYDKLSDAINESEDERNKRIIIANEMHLLNNKIKAVSDYLTKYYEPKIEYSRIYASKDALDIINLIQSIKYYEPKIEYSGIYASKGALDIINLIQSIK